MSTPPQPPGAKPSGPTSDERTRDIRLPSPAPARPDAAVPGATPTAAQPTAGSDQASSGLPASETVRLQQPSPEALSGRADPADGQATDKLSSPSPVRQQTLAFGAPAAGSPGAAASGSLPDFSAPAPSVPRAAPVSPRRPLAPPGTGAPSYGSATDGAAPAATRERRWPWVVLILLPILVIAVSGVLLFLLLGGA